MVLCPPLSAGKHHRPYADPVTHPSDARWWGWVSAATAPVALIGGWTLAAARQPSAYDPVRDTISSLAAVDATDRWVMTGGLAVLGACHVVTACALTGAGRGGRALLAAGGVATLGVAALPLGRDSTQGPHGWVAGAAFLALAVWPLAAGRRGGAADLEPASSWVLRRPAGVVAGAALLGLVTWFGAELAGDTDRVGLAERVAAGAQSLWPLLVVATLRRG